MNNQIEKARLNGACSQQIDAMTAAENAKNVNEKNSFIPKNEASNQKEKTSENQNSNLERDLINSGITFIGQNLQTMITDEVVEQGVNAINNIMREGGVFNGLGAALQEVGGNVSTTGIPTSAIASGLRAGARYGIPILGTVIDFGIGVASGESVGDAATKAVAHTVISTLCTTCGEAIGTAVAPGGGTIVGAVIGALVGVGINIAFDYCYDNSKEKINDSSED